MVVVDIEPAGWVGFGECGTPVPGDTGPSVVIQTANEQF